MTNKLAFQIVVKLGWLADAHGLVADQEQREALEYMQSFASSADLFSDDEEE